MQILDFVNESSIVLVPVLYIAGTFIKETTLVKDKYIPIALMTIGILSSIGLAGLNVNSIVQGVLVAGVAVLGNQTVKQLKKEE